MEISVYTSTVWSEMNRPNTMTVKISTWVNDVRREIADGNLPILATPSQGAYRFTWSQSSTSITLTTSIKTNSWPGDFIECQSFFDVANERALERVDAVYFDQLLQSSTDDLTDTGTPHTYIDRGATYDLYPSPSSATEYILRYTGYPANLVAGSVDATVMDTEVPMLVMYAVCLKYARYLHDEELIKHYKEIVTEYYLAATTKDKMRKWRGRQLKMKSVNDFSVAQWKGIHHIGEAE